MNFEEIKAVASKTLPVIQSELLSHIAKPSARKTISNLPRSAVCASKGEWGAGREGRRGVELKDSLTEFKDSFTSIKDSLTEFKDSFTSIKDSLTEFKDSSASIKDSFTSIKDSSASIKDSSASIKDSFTSIKDSSASIKDSFTSIKDSSASIKDSFPIPHAQCPMPKYYAVTASRRLYPEASPLIASLCLPSMPTGRSPTIVTR